MAARDQQNWYLALRRGVEFAAATEIMLVEVLQYPSLADPRWSERNLDDTKLQGLFDEVMAVNTHVNRSLSCFRIYLIPAQYLESQSRLVVDCGYCKDHSLDAYTIANIGLARIATCDWVPEQNLISLSMKKESFSFLNKQLVLHENFLNLITSSHTRGLLTVESGQHGPKPKGFYQHSLSLRALADTAQDFCSRYHSID
jgi:hypothetical protein